MVAPSARRGQDREIEYRPSMRPSPKNLRSARGREMTGRQMETAVGEVFRSSQGTLDEFTLATFPVLQTLIMLATLFQIMGPSPSTRVSQWSSNC